MKFKNKPGIVRMSMLAAVFLSMVNTVCFAEKAAVLPELSDPASFHIDGERIYIVERTTIHIYSSKDYTLIKKFGKRGEGPGEFRTGQESSVLLYVQPDYLQVNLLFARP